MGSHRLTTRLACEIWRVLPTIRLGALGGELVREPEVVLLSSIPDVEEWALMDSRLLGTVEKLGIERNSGSLTDCTVRNVGFSLHKLLMLATRYRAILARKVRAALL